MSPPDDVARDVSDALSGTTNFLTPSEDSYWAIADKAFTFGQKIEVKFRG